MARRGTPAAAELLELGVKLALDAAEKVLGDPRGQAAVSAASELAQKAVLRLEELQRTVTRAARPAGRDELHELEAKVEELQRRARDLGARLEALGRERRPAGARAAGAKPRWRDPDEDLDR